MTDQTPREAGFYWARHSARDEFEPVLVDRFVLQGGFIVFAIGTDQCLFLEDFTWGPRITLPDELEGVK